MNIRMGGTGPGGTVGSREPSYHRREVQRTRPGVSKESGTGTILRGRRRQELEVGTQTKRKVEPVRKRFERTKRAGTSYPR